MRDPADPELIRYCSRIGDRPMYELASGHIPHPPAYQCPVRRRQPKYSLHEYRPNINDNRGKNSDNDALNNDAQSRSPSGMHVDIVDSGMIGLGQHRSLSVSEHHALLTANSSRRKLSSHAITGEYTCEKNRREERGRHRNEADKEADDYGTRWAKAPPRRGNNDDASWREYNEVADSLGG